MMFKLFAKRKSDPLLKPIEHLDIDTIDEIHFSLYQQPHFIQLFKKCIVHIVNCIDNDILNSERLKNPNYAIETAFKLGQKKALNTILDLLTEQNLKEKEKDEQ